MSDMHPRISVIVTHYNYARYVGSALLSVIHQSFTEWEAIVVDDASTPMEYEILQEIVAELADDRIRLIRNEENAGQITAIFRGLAEARGDFIALLDPDDLYEPMFLEIMLAAFMNNTHNAAVAACEMGVFNDRVGAVCHHSTGFRMRVVSEGRYDEVTASQLLNGFGEYFPPWKTGWIWGATSGLMFRRTILEAIAPMQAISLSPFEGDSYCATGCHMIGGTVFVDQMLSWRRTHDHNTAKNPIVVFDNQNRHRADYQNILWDVTVLVAETILSNAGLVRMGGSPIVSAVVAHLGYEGLATISERSPAVKDALFSYSAGVI